MSSFNSSKLGKLSAGGRAPWLLTKFRKTRRGLERQRRSRVKVNLPVRSSKLRKLSAGGRVPWLLTIFRKSRRNYETQKVKGQGQFTCSSSSFNSSKLGKLSAGGRAPWLLTTSRKSRISSLEELAKLLCWPSPVDKNMGKHMRYCYLSYLQQYWWRLILYSFWVIVKAVTLTFISGHGLAISSAQ